MISSFIDERGSSFYVIKKGFTINLRNDIMISLRFSLERCLCLRMVIIISLLSHQGS